MRGRGEDRTAARSGRITSRARVSRERRVLWVALALSALGHILVLAIVGGLLDRETTVTPRARAIPVRAEPPPGMRALNLRPTPGDVPVAPAEPVPRTAPPVADAPPAERLEPEETQPRIAADDRTAADRLAPRLIDPRLWRPVVLIPREPTLADVQARVDAALELLSDSALAEAQRQIDATDWTVLDENGEKWGISPGVIHLGKLKIPLPIYYVEEYDPRRGEWYDLEAQVDRTRFLESFEDRVRRIRERRDRERREGRGEDGAVAGGNGGGP